MSSSTQIVEVPQEIVEDALQSAAREGKTLQQWAQSILQERVRLERCTSEFLIERAKHATGEGLRWALENAPDRRPDPGDEL